MKSVIKYGFILVCVVVTLLATYIGVLMKTKGEAEIRYADSKLHITSNWRTNSIYAVRIWEQGSDTYEVFTTRGAGKNFTLDLRNIPESVRNLADSPAEYKKGKTYYIALDVQYDIPVAASIRTQYFEFLFSDRATKISETNISHSEQPEWLGR